MPRLQDVKVTVAPAGAREARYGFRCRCTIEAGDSFCMVHPTCNHCGEELKDFATQAEIPIEALLVALHASTLEEAHAEIARLRRVDDAAKELTRTLGGAS